MPAVQISSRTFDGRPAVRFGDGIALLDVAADSYACIYDPTGRPTAVSFPDTRAIESDPARGPDDQDISARWRELPATEARLGLRDVLCFAAALVIVAIRFHRHAFRDLLALRPLGGALHGTTSPDELALIVARFERMALFLPVRILCLFRSFFLLHFLRRYGRTADWVFGVTLFPFRAHCWLASGDLLIGERAYRAKRFSPILVVPAGHP